MIGQIDYQIVPNTLNGPKLFLDVFKWLLYGPIGFEAGEQGFFIWFTINLAILSQPPFKENVLIIH